MSKTEDKIKHSTRLHNKEVAINKQTRIAKEFGIPVKEAHKFAKMHAMNCGNPKCFLCSNPRKTFKELTAQEQRLFQDIDGIRDRHSNGLNIKEEND